MASWYSIICFLLNADCQNLNPRMSILYLSFCPQCLLRYRILNPQRSILWLPFYPQCPLLNPRVNIYDCLRYFSRMAWVAHFICRKSLASPWSCGVTAGAIQNINIIHTSLLSITSNFDAGTKNNFFTIIRIKDQSLKTGANVNNNESFSSMWCAFINTSRPQRRTVLFLCLETSWFLRSITNPTNPAQLRHSVAMCLRKHFIISSKCNTCLLHKISSFGMLVQPCALQKQSMS